MLQQDALPALPSAPPELPWSVEDGTLCSQIRQDILAGRLDAEERLKISELASRYGTSTNPVREALQQLRGEGLVTIEPNRGARVRKIDEDFVRDIHELAELVEPYLLRWFVGICNDDHIRRLETIQARIEALNFTDGLLHSQLDQHFHQITYERHYNRSTVELWWRNRTILTGINRRRSISLRRQREVIEEHRGLIAALRDHDEDRAAALIARHVRGAGRHIIDRMRSERAGAL
jgi:DNA-binding GntR family transcriptional regulator